MDIRVRDREEATEGGSLFFWFYKDKNVPKTILPS